MHALVDARRGSARPSSARCPTRYPGPCTGSPGLARGDPLDSGRSRSPRIRALSTRLRGWSRDGKNEPVRSSGIASSSSPAVVATVLRRLPLRRLVRSGVRDAALRADHGGGPEPRPGPRDPARGQAAQDAHPARSGSARTSRISVDTAHWFVAGIVRAPPGESWSKNRAPTIPAAPRASGPPRRPGPRGNRHHTKRRTRESAGFYANPDLIERPHPTRPTSSSNAGTGPGHRPSAVSIESGQGDFEVS